VSFKTFLQKVVSGLHKFFHWFQENVQPELVEFLDANKNLAVQTVKDVAIDLVGATGEAKRNEAMKRIDDRLCQALPSIVLPNHWLALLVEVAVTVLKAQGRIK